MNLRILFTILLVTASAIAPVNAQPATQTPTTSNQVLNACVQDRADTLPIPFSDVSPNHWAFKAVMTMYYCGAFRKATPPALFQQLRPTEPQQQQRTQPNQVPQ